MINQLSIIGLGLMGGSVALAAKQHNVCKKIVAYDINEIPLHKAKALNIIDDYSTDINTAIAHADMILLATSVQASVDAVAQINTTIHADTILTDVASVKAFMIEKITAILGEKQIYYVPGHPIAGSEKSGIDAARADLFINQQLILTPTETTDANAFSKVKQFWQQLGAKVIIMDAATHDKIFAMVSHLPQLLAYALMNTVGDNKDYTKHIYKGFNEITRIAASDPNMWADIYLTNKANVLDALNQLQQQISAITTAINKQDSHFLQKSFAQSKAYKLAINSK